MSHELKMYVQNNSSYTLRSYTVVHSWDGHNEILRGENLPNGGTNSPSIQITSGYTQYDWYTVQFDFDVIGVRQTNFYCNSSNADDRCVVNVHDKFLNLEYYDGPKYNGGCQNKGYSGDFVAEIEQVDPNKVEPVLN